MHSVRTRPSLRFVLRFSAFALALLAAPIFTRPLRAQIVVGRIVNRETGEPLEAAFVVLLDSEGVGRARTLTNSGGRYVLRAPGPGQYTVRAELIGYASHVSQPLDLAADEAKAYDMAISYRAIELESIEVSGEQRCTVRPGEGARTAEVWEEARKALELAVWTQEEGTVRFRAVGFERELDAQARSVLSERSTGRSGYAVGSPYRSRPAEDLEENGYVRREEDGTWSYYAPDAQVLLSDPFLDTHCFELSAQDSRPDLIGLAFRPIERYERANIRGVLWLDRRSAELRYLEFTYTWLPYPVESSLIGGQVDFDRLGNGPWIVSSWRIRMPEVELGRQVFGTLRMNAEDYRITGIREVGADVRDVEDRSGASVLGQGRGGGSVAGRVYGPDGVTGAADADVSVVGTARDTRTDGRGGFQLTGLPGGVYQLQITPRAWALPWLPPASEEVTVQEGDTSRVEVRLPGPAEIAEAFCGDAVDDTLPGVILGQVTDPVTGSPVAGREVVVAWSGFVLSQDVGRLSGQRRWRAMTVMTDQEGWYRACGVPAETLVRVRTVPLGSLTADQIADRLWQPDVPLPPDVREVRIGFDDPIERMDLKASQGEDRGRAGEGTEPDKP